jgi:hypothetical protein
MRGKSRIATGKNSYNHSKDDEARYSIPVPE